MVLFPKYMKFKLKSHILKGKNKCPVPQLDFTKTMPNGDKSTVTTGSWLLCCWVYPRMLTVNQLTNWLGYRHENSRNRSTWHQIPINKILLLGSLSGFFLWIGPPTFAYKMWLETVKIKVRENRRGNQE